MTIKPKVIKSNQVWQTDISYIEFGGDFLYLVAFIDVYSRYVTGWGIFTSLESEYSVEVLFRAIYLHQKPQIINTDRGSQYVCDLWTRYLEREGIVISMNDPGKPTQNIYIERFWKTIKYNFLFLQNYSTIDELERKIGWFVDYYNYERPHKGIDGLAPAMLYNDAKYVGADYFYHHNAIKPHKMIRTHINLNTHIFNLYEKHKLYPEQKGDYIYLHFNQSESPSIIVRVIDNASDPLRVEDVRSHFEKFTQLASQTGCWQFRLICPNGFTEECHAIEEYNIALSDNSYIKSLEDFYHLELYAHNENSYKRVTEAFRITDRAAVVQATGTGKSLIISKLLLDNREKNILVLAPSTYIISEIKKHLIFNSKKNLTFATYAKLSKSKDASLLDTKFDIIVLDEFHRCGATEWGDAIIRLLGRNVNSKVLGTSATPIRYLDGARNMADEFFGGNVVQNISIARAIAQNILPTPIYVSALYSFDDNYKSLMRKIKFSEVQNKSAYLKQLRDLRTNWNNSSGVPIILKKHLPDTARKILVFCKNIEHLQKIRSVISKWFYTSWAKRINVYELHSELNNKRVFKEFKREKDSELDILLVVDMLNEGIHTKGIDAIIMLRDTTSPNIYYQQLGRCMSVKLSETPVIFDFVNNFETIRVSEFVNQYNLECISIEGLRSLQTNSATKFIVIDETKDIQELYNSLSNSIEKWEIKFALLQEFHRQNGHTIVPQSDMELYVWCNNQKQQRRKGELGQHRIEKLNSINFRWRYVDNSWNEAYLKLKEFQRLHNHCRAPKSDGFLSAWCVRQRKDYRNGELSASQIKRLDKLGFIWEPKNILWNKMFPKLQEFHRLNGHSRIKFSDDKELHIWCVNMKKSIKNGSLSADKLRQIELCDFDLSIMDTIWEESFNKLVIFYKEQGHSMVPASYNQTLASWVLTQRAEYKNGRIKPERHQRLMSVDFVWNVDEYLWEQKLNLMREHLCQTQRNRPLVVNGSLYEWYKDQKNKKAKGKLNNERLNRLRKIGLDI